MKIVNKTIEFNTGKELDFIDLTEKVEDFINQSQMKTGFVNIQTLHTTCPLLLNENEPLLLDDVRNHLKNLSPKDLPYNHNDFTRRTVNMCKDECENGHSHCLALHFPSNLTINIIEGKLQLGQWQRIFLVELDRPRRRSVQIQAMGEQ